MKCLKGNPISPIILCRCKFNSEGVTIYSDGYCEMFGRKIVNNSFADRVSWIFRMNLSVPYRDADYSVILTGSNMATDKIGWFGLNVENVTTSSFDAYFYSGVGVNEINTFYFTTKGYVNLDDPVVKAFIEEHRNTGTQIKS